MPSKRETSQAYKATFGDETYGKLIQFEEELIKWNRKFSFTSVPDSEIFHRLIAPSAWLGVEYAKERVGEVADFGCGPGIPGAVMAIVDSANKYLLYDSNEKKIGFVRHILSIPGILGGSEAKAFALRVTPESIIEPVNRLVTRAAGRMEEVLELWRGKVRPGGVADFYKGDDAEGEIESLMKSYPQASSEVLETPGWFGKLRIVRINGVF